MENSYLNNQKNPVILSIVATRSNTGKTTLIESLVKILKGKNYSVGVLKHDAHKFDIDKEGKDTYRFAKAGADNVVISSSEKLAMIQKLNEEREIEDILTLFNGLDIVLIEGFKNNNYPKIEVHRKGVDHNLLYKDASFNTLSFIAVASDESLPVDIPVLDLNDTPSIVQFIENRMLIKKESLYG